MNRGRTISAFLQGSVAFGALCFTPLALAVKSIVVNSAADLPDDDSTDGVCHTIAGTCTLRAAIMQARHADPAVTDGVVITLPAGSYHLDLPLADGGGELYLTDPTIGNPYIEIDGAGAKSTVISGEGIDRVFHIAPLRYSTISGVTISGGNPPGAGALADGAGIRNEGQLALVSSIVSENYASHYGGGIFNSGTLTISTSSIAYNVAIYDGGGIFSGSTIGANLYVSDSTIASNTSNYGGGIFNSAGMVVNDSTIANNYAYNFGGGVYSHATNSAANIYNATIVGNISDFDGNGRGAGGGIFAVTGAGDGSGRTNVYNTIVAGNYNGLTYNDCSGTLYTHARNRFFEASSCALVQVSGSYAALNSLALLGPLQHNGGPTMTIALLSGSNAINAGDPTFGCLNSNGLPITLDQRLFPRNVGVCDIGAYEYGALDPADMIFANGFDM